MLLPIEIADPLLSQALSRVSVAAAGRAYLVGGAVRDLLLGRKPRDLDVVLQGKPLPLAQSLEQDLQCKAIVLRESPGVVRLAWHGGAQILDLLELEGTLEQDLRRRDCTVNAMALRLVGGAEGLGAELQDPLGGKKDLEARLLRMTCEKALLQDPLRVLRVFRLSAQLAFNVERETEAAIKRHASVVRQAAPERVQEELLLLLDSTPCYEALKGCVASGVLLHVLPELGPLRGVGQDGYHHLDAFDHTLEVVRAVEGVLLGQQPLLRAELLERARTALARPFLAGCSEVAMLKLAALLHDLGKPLTRTVEEDGTHFYRHSVVGEEMATAIGERLRFSREAQRRVALLVREHLRPGFLADLEPPSPRALNRFFRRLGGEAVAALLLGLADRMAARGPAASEEWLVRLARTANELLAEHFRRLGHPEAKVLLDGHQIMARYGLQPGRLVGKALALLRRAQEEGLVHTPEQAQAFLDEKMPQLLGESGAR